MQNTALIHVQRGNFLKFKNFINEQISQQLSYDIHNLLNDIQSFAE